MILQFCENIFKVGEQKASECMLRVTQIWVKGLHLKDSDSISYIAHIHIHMSNYLYAYAFMAHIHAHA